MPADGAALSPAPGRMALSLRSLDRLYNPLDASPFHQKDLDPDAERFILDWVAELPPRAPLSLVIHLDDWPDAAQRQSAVRGIGAYFEQGARRTRRELATLLRQGRLSLVIGLSFLGLCLLASEYLASVPDSLGSKLLSQSLTVGGWVAMWRPLQIYLYDWWPLRRRLRDYHRLARMPIELVGR